MNIKEITNVSDCEPLYIPQSLYLKPYAKFDIKVFVPTTNNAVGKSISNFEIVEHIKNALKPDKLDAIKATKSTLKCITFEVEIEDKNKLKHLIHRLNKLTIQLKDFKYPFKVEATVVNNYPTRHDWDTYFRDANDMDEMKPGERPDTCSISNLPIRWFCPRHKENDKNVKPSESIFKRIFEKYGSVRCIDIPICDSYRSQMKTEIAGIPTPIVEETLFTGYVQFSEYVGFARAMDAFRSMRLIRKSVDKNYAINIHVTFDKTKHLSDANIKRRKIVRDRLIGKEKNRIINEEKIQQEEIEKTISERKKNEEAQILEINKQREREERRKQKVLKKLEQQGQLEVSSKIRNEQRKMFMARRKLESIRVLDAIFERLRIKECMNQKKTGNSDDDDSRKRLVNKYKQATEELYSQQKEKFEELKSKSGLMAIIKKNRNDSSKKNIRLSSDDDLAQNEIITNSANPFMDVCTPELAKEWLKMNLIANLQSYQSFIPVTSHRGGFYKSRGRGSYRGRVRGSYRRFNKSHFAERDRSSTSSYNRRRSRTRSRTPRKRYYSRSRSSRSSSKSRSRSNSRRRRSYSSSPQNAKKSQSISRDNNSKNGRDYHRSRSRSVSKKRNKLCSTRRSRSSSGWSRSRTNSREAENKKFTIEPERIVRSAENIQKLVKQKLTEELINEKSKIESTNSTTTITEL